MTTVTDNRKQPMRIQPRTSSKAVTQQVTTNTNRGITGVTPVEAPQYRYLTQGDPVGEPVGIAPVNRGD